MSLTTLAEVRALVSTPLTDAQLQVVIDRVESDITERLGPLQDQNGNVTVTETGRVSRGGRIFTRQIPASVVSLSVGAAALSADDYTLHGAGWISGVGVVEPTAYTITYKPKDIRHRVRQVVIDLVRLIVNRTAMQSESVAGEYSYTAPEWEREYNRLLRRVVMAEVG